LRNSCQSGKLIAMDGGAGGKHGGQARCVVWRPRGSPLPGPLASALVRPDFQVTECDNQFEAVANLCLRREASQQAVLLVVEPKMLPTMSEVGEIIDRYAPNTTLWMFENQPAPQIRAVTPADREAWERESPVNQAAGAENVPVQRVGPVLRTAVREIADDALTSTRLKMPQPPRLRLAGEGPVSPRPAAAEPELKVKPAEPPAPVLKPAVLDAEDGPGISSVQSGKPGHLLSDEELEMLLAPDPDKGNY
jgi:hypothetical protein